MAGKKIIAICQSGGEFQTDKDDFLSYKGGDAHAMEIDEKMKFNDFKMEVTEMCNCSLCTVTFKYFLPGHKKTLITISSDKDFKHMMKFHGDSSTIDIYVLTEEVIAPDFSNMPASRSSRTSLSEAGALADTSPDDGVDNTTQPGLLIDATFDVIDDTARIVADIEMPTVLHAAPLSLVGSNDENHVKAAQQWHNNITGVGQRFNSVNEFREALRKYAIAHRFCFRYKKNDNQRVTVKCKADGCPWRIHASRLSTTQLVCIKKMNPMHTCKGYLGTTGFQATRSWVANIIKEKLKVFPNYKPKDIVNDIKQEYGIQLNYFQAWRGKEFAKEELQGSYKEAYSRLPFLCEKIMETNPGSLATFTTKEDSSFHRLFVSFHASLFGFRQGCRPLLFLDSITLQSKYQGTLLTVTSADGEDDVFPVAFGIVDTESNDNWRWFLQQLKSALSTYEGITFVSDREKGLRESIAETFENEHVYHAYCLRYLTEQLIRDMKSHYSHEVRRLIVEDLCAAASAPVPEGFQKCIESIKSLSQDAYDWIIQSEPMHWANAFFQGARYNHMASNFGEVFYRWISDAHKLPITQMVDAIRCKIMEFTYARRADSNQWLSRLTPSMEKKLSNENQKIDPLQVFTAGDRYEVHGDSIEVVDIDHCTCSCKVWQLTGMPCCHAIAVIKCLGRDLYDYCARYYTSDNYRLTYSEPIHPIPTEDPPLQKDPPAVVVSVTPPVRRPPGRPSTKKFGSPEIVKRQVQCSKCRAIGHNKSTCKEEF